MKTLRTLFMALPVLSLVGCGCTGDEGGGFTSPERGLAFRIATKVEPIPVRPPDGVVKIDVFFLLDDSGLSAAANGTPLQGGMVYGDISNQPGRNKQQVAIAIFDDVVTKLKADLIAADPTKTYDLAFGVGRFEDFGGSFRTLDKQARPFILNMPLLRQLHPLFNGLITPALTRIAPGVGSDIASATDILDSETSIEALFQIATGNGFDANGNATTLDSGAFGSLTMQTSPGVSGDVPAKSYTPALADPDGFPVFTTPGNSVASGNIGGAGWRPDALRYVITTSDISAVSPFPALGGVPATITSTAGVNYPRVAAAIPSNAFASRGGTTVQQRVGRFGELPEPVAPTGAATVQGTINALNALDIEVLSIGTPRTAPTPLKPNLPGAVSPDVSSVATPTNPSPAPFTWMSAVALLTGARRPYPTPADPIFPLVYNLATVFPIAGVVQNHVREDLVHRVGQALLVVPPPGGIKPPLTDAVYDFTLALPVPGGSPFSIGSIVAIDRDAQDAQDQSVTVVAGQTIRLKVPRFYSDVAAPASRRIEWLVQVTENLSDNLIKSDTWAFTIAGAAVSANNPPFEPTPAQASRLASVLQSWPPAPPTNVPTAVVTAHVAGCVIVRDENHATETTAGPCP